MDNDFPTTMANGGGLDFLQQYLRGEEGDPLYGEQMISGGPSFNMTPDIDDPSIDRWLQLEREKPGYVKPRIPSGPERRKGVENFRQRYGHLFV